MRITPDLSAETRRLYRLNNRWQAVALFSMVPFLLFILVVGGPRLQDWWVDTILGVIAAFSFGCLFRAFHYLRLSLRSYRVDKQRAELRDPA